jgi:sulfoxide reductase heme-binding subunit YedZ
MHKSRWPWKDRSGRFSPMKAVMLVAAFLPGLWLAFAWATHSLGARPLTAVIHGTGQ